MFLWSLYKVLYVIVLNFSKIQKFKILGLNPVVTPQQHQHYFWLNLHLKLKLTISRDPTKDYKYSNFLDCFASPTKNIKLPRHLWVSHSNSTPRALSHIYTNWLIILLLWYEYHCVLKSKQHFLYYLCSWNPPHSVKPRCPRWQRQRLPQGPSTLTKPKLLWQWSKLHWRRLTMR